MSPAAFPVSPLTPSGDKNFVISFSRVHSGGFRLRQAWCPGHPRAFESEGDVQSGVAGCPPPLGRPGSGGSSPPGSLPLFPSPPRLMRLPTACRQTCARLFALRSASHRSVGLLMVSSVVEACVESIISGGSGISLSEPIGPPRLLTVCSAGEWLHQGVDPLLPHPLPPTTPRSPNSAAAASTLLGCLPSSPTALS